MPALPPKSKSINILAGHKALIYHKGFTKSQKKTFKFQFKKSIIRSTFK